MTKILKKFITVFLCICSVIPYITYGKEARDQDKEVNNNVEENNSDINTNQEEKNTSENKSTSTNSTSDTLNLSENAKSAIMIEPTTGKIIYEKNSHESMPMASMTKIMTLLLIMENIENGNLKWDEKVKASEYASSMGGSQIFLQPGEEMTVEDLVKGICIGSGNELAVSIKQSHLLKEEIII